MTVTCQHTGVEFEARSKAAKNHPVVSALLAEAHKRGAYQAVLDLLAECRSEGIQDLTVIERLAGAAIDGRRAELQTERDLWRQRRDEARQAWRERQGVGEEDADRAAVDAAGTPYLTNESEDY